MTFSAPAFRYPYPCLLLLAALLLPLSAHAQTPPAARPDGAIRITQGLGSEQNPCLSPDGGSLVFTRFTNGYNQGPSALVLLDLATGQERVLANDNDHDHVNLPGRCFSPDGKRIAYSSDASGNDEIWVLDLETGEAAQITDHSDEDAQAFEPAFSHDGSRIVFELAAGDRGGQIMSVASEGGDEQPLTPGDADGRQPNPSPASDQVLFQSDRGGTWGLWTVLLDGGEPAPFHDTEAEETDASWSPDGDAVVFATDACAALSCIAVHRDGQVIVPATPENWYEGAPAMADNGTIFAEAAPGDPESGGRTAIYRLP